MAVVDFRIPFEIVVGLTEPPNRPGLLRVLALARPPRVRQPAADARIISGPLKNRRCRDDPARQHDLLRPASAPMVVSTDRRLIHPRDKARATRRTHRRRRKSTAEPRAFPRQPIHVGRRDQSLPVTRKICRHVVDDEPQDIRPPFGGRRRTDRDERAQGQQNRAEDFHGVTPRERPRSALAIRRTTGPLVPSVTKPHCLNQTVRLTPRIDPSSRLTPHPTL